MKRSEIMRIVAINSSMRKGRTYELLNNVVSKLPYDSEIINLKDYNIKFCLGCENCLKRDKCVINDDMEFLMNKILEADGLILSSPVYIENVSGLLKTFLDRTCKWYHRPPLLGKPVLLVATTAGSALKSVLNYMEKVVISWGMKPCGKIGKKISEKREVNERDIEKFIKALENPNSREYVGLIRLMRFQVQKAMAKNVIKIDKEYWRRTRLLEARYFYEIKADPLSQLIAASFGKFLSNKIGENVAQNSLNLD